MPWLPEAHERLEMPTVRTRLRARWRRFLHPHGMLLDRLARMIELQCPACGLWRKDPTTGCPRCGL